MDDVERKHHSLSIEEVFGLADEHRNQYKNRVLLLLNRGKLKDKRSWKKLHEKVVDLEIVLDPKPGEALDAAILNVTHVVRPYLSDLRDAVEVVGLTKHRGTRCERIAPGRRPGVTVSD